MDEGCPREVRGGRVHGPLAGGPDEAATEAVRRASAAERSFGERQALLEEAERLGVDGTALPLAELRRRVAEERRGRPG